MRVLVTGGGGFLGSYIVRDLLKENFKVISLSRNFYSSLAELHVPQINKDLNDLELHDLEGIEAIIHTAGIPGIWGKKEAFFKANFEGTKKLVGLAKASEIKYFIYTSSPSVVFQDNNLEGVGEETPYPSKFYTYYQESKKLAEEFVLSSISDNFMAISLRPHLIWGTGDQNLFPRLVKRGREGKLKRVGDGTNLVDVIYVKNASFAHVSALKKLVQDNSLSGRSYFVGDPEPVNLWDFINTVLEREGIEKVEDSISFKFAFFIGAIFEFIFKTLGIYKPEPPMTRFLALQLAKSHYFTHARAKDDFNYIPPYTTEEGLSEYFKDKIKVNEI